MKSRTSANTKPAQQSTRCSTSTTQAVQHNLPTGGLVLQLHEQQSKRRTARCSRDQVWIRRWIQCRLPTSNDAHHVRTASTGCRSHITCLQRRSPKLSGTRASCAQADERCWQERIEVHPGSAKRRNRRRRRGGRRQTRSEQLRFLQV